MVVQSQHGPVFLDLDPADPHKNAPGAVVLQIPYEGTTCYRSGTREGPGTIIAASAQVELYDNQLGFEPAQRYVFHTAEPFEPTVASPEETVASIAEYVGAHLEAGRLLLCLGGEHSVSVGVLRALLSSQGTGEANDLCVLQLDAHCDLRNSYQGSRFSHACTARRMLDEGASRVVQVGVRNVSAEGAEFLKAHEDKVTAFFADEFRDGSTSPRDPALLLAGRNVLIDIDLDVFDPSEMPAVGTPEPGGLRWNEVLDVCRETIRAAGAVAGVNVVELAPIPGNVVGEFTAAKLAYKLSSLALAHRAGDWK